MERTPVGVWLEQLDQSGEAQLLFESAAHDAQQAPEQRAPYGGMSRAEFDKLPARKKLEIANAQAAAAARKAS